MSRSASFTGVLAAVFLLLHLPFLPASLEDLDSINFAMGVRHFDVAEHQPHPPGYPVYILVAKAIHAVVPSEARALALLSVCSGALAILAMAAMYRALDPESRSLPRALLATTIAGSAPLFWFTAARPLSDMAGLAASLGIQALVLTARSGEGLAAAAFLSGLGGGIRSQVLWLTVPLVAVAAARRPRVYRLEDTLVATGAFIAGVLLWFVPLVWLTGGPTAYWRALAGQGTEDLTGVGMLWTTHTVQQLRLAFNSTVVAPWGTPVLAGPVVALAAIGTIRLLWKSRAPVGLLAAAFGPYLVFDLLFQESVTTRYALPLVVPFAYLAVRGLDGLPARAASALAVAISLAGLVVVGLPSVLAFSQEDAPAFRLLKDMRAASPTLGAPPVLATHRRESLDLRRPIAWTAEEMPSFSQKSAAPPKHEWLELVKYWNAGGRAPVWFVADPLRSDLALADHAPPRASYRWPLKFPLLIGGVRPNEMDWYVIDRPSWYLGEGWSLTPETAGVAKEDGRGPAHAPIQGWIRRDTRPVTLMIGGRNLSAQGAASLRVTLDGQPLMERTIQPGFFLETMTLEPSRLSGNDEYAALLVSAQGDVAIEQFDAQNSDRVMFGYGPGWYEMEYNPATGRSWRWMSEQGRLPVRGTGRDLLLTLEGTTEAFSGPSHLVIRVGDRRLLEQEVGDSFLVRVTIPAALLQGQDSIVTVETDQVYVPAERSSKTSDRRHLGLKVFKALIASAGN